MAQAATTVGHGNVVVQVAGDGNWIELGLAHLHLTRHVQRRTVRREENGEFSAADLVTAYTRSVALIGRDADRAALWSWMENGRPISVRVMVGGAGRGKTRLALELCEEAATRGWQAGFVTSAELRRFRQQQNLSSWDWHKNLFWWWRTMPLAMPSCCTNGWWRWPTVRRGAIRRPGKLGRCGCSCWSGKPT